MSSAAVPQRILHAAGRSVRFAVAAGAHSLAVLEQQPQTNGDLRRSLGMTPAVWPFTYAMIPYSSMNTAACVCIDAKAQGQFRMATDSIARRLRKALLHAFGW